MHGLQADWQALASRLGLAASTARVWDLTGLTALDSAGALLLWQAWGEAWPQQLRISEAHRRVIERVAGSPAPEPVAAPECNPYGLVYLGTLGLQTVRHCLGMITLLGQVALDALYLCRYPQRMPWKEVSANIFRAGVLALPVSGLVGFLIGVTLSYLSAVQLKAFGAEQFIVNLLGISIIRELGPVLVAVLVAGRSGSSMTAQLGVMRVTEEIDALAVMGVSRSLRVVFPKLVALTVVMPFLVLWTSALALLGGMLAAFVQLDLSVLYFAQNLPRAVPVANVLIGLGKGLVFGSAIALVACYFGLQVKPNTESLAARTTTSVVTAITVVILIDAVFAITTQGIGIPGGMR